MELELELELELKLELELELCNLCNLCNLLLCNLLLCNLLLHKSHSDPSGHWCCKLLVRTMPLVRVNTHGTGCNNEPCHLPVPPELLDFVWGGCPPSLYHHRLLRVAHVSIFDSSFGTLGNAASHMPHLSHKTPKQL